MEVEVIVEIPKGSATSTRSTTTPARPGSTARSSRRRCTRPTTASSPTRWARTATRSTPWSSSTSRRSPAATSWPGRSACSGCRTRPVPTPRCCPCRPPTPAGPRVQDLDDLPPAPPRRDRPLLRGLQGARARQAHEPHGVAQRRHRRGRVTEARSGSPSRSLTPETRKGAARGEGFRTAPCAHQRDPHCRRVPIARGEKPP